MGSILGTYYYFYKSNYLDFFFLILKRDFTGILSKNCCKGQEIMVTLNAKSRHMHRTVNKTTSRSFEPDDVNQQLISLTNLAKKRKNKIFI